MSGMIPRANTQSVEYTGNQTFEANQNRRYFFIVMTSGAGTIEFGNGGGAIPLAEGGHYCPYVCPLSEISVVTAGTFVVHWG